MNRYVVTLTDVKMMIEVDAPDEQAAKACIWNHFRKERAYDPLQS